MLQDTLPQISVFFLLTGIVLVVTYLHCRRVTGKDITSSKEFFLAGKRLSWVFVAGSITITNVSTFQFVGMNGAQAIVIAWWELAAGAGMIILGKTFVPIYYHNRCATTNELLEQRLHNKNVRALVSILFLVTLPTIGMPVLLYMSSLFIQSIGVEVPLTIIAAALVILASGYAGFGGLRAVAVSGTYYGIGLFVMGLLVLVLSVNAIQFDFSGIPQERLTLIGDENSQIPWQTLLTGMIFIQIFYWSTNQYITQRALACDSIAEARKGVYAAALVRTALLPAMVSVPGVVAFKLYGDVGDRAYGELVNNLLPWWLSGAFAAIIAGAVVSTLSANLNSAASLYTCDIHERYVNPRPNARLLSLIIALLFSVLAVALVPMYNQTRSIIYLAQQLNGFYSMPVLAAFFVALLFENVDPRAVIGTLVFGTLLYAFFTFAWTPLHYIHLMLVTLVLSVIFALWTNRFFFGNRATFTLRMFQFRSAS